MGFQLPDPGEYGVGMIFLPDQRDQRRRFEKTIERIIGEEGQTCLGWRKVPTDNMYLGESAKESEPFVRQVFIGRNTKIHDEIEFERKLYVIRRRAENAIRYAGLAGGDFFYVPSMSCRTLIYKGMLTPRQVTTFYPDLSDPLVESAIAVVHSRFSTNTFPSWGRAHPYRYLIHNGEINTLRGNENWMHAVYTRSTSAWRLLALWQETAPKFVKVMPKDYRRVLEALEEAEAKGLIGDDALMAAFEANKNDAARVSGN